MTKQFDILLSPPHLNGDERAEVQRALESNWIAPVGPAVDAFERAFAARHGLPAALATNSGTAALHLALRVAGVGPGDSVLVSTLTFVASAAPIVQLGARPIFVDSERASWNIDPELVERHLVRAARAGRLPKALVVVHVFGQPADLEPIGAMCAHHGVTLIEDAAEALGATVGGRPVGSIGQLAAFSFNGNKIITTSSGGMLVATDPELIAKARKLATQAREPAPHYEHRELGYNYRMSNLLAALGSAQLRHLDERVAARRRNFSWYRERLRDVPGLELMPAAEWGRHTRWLTTMTVVAAEFGANPRQIRRALAADRIEARPIWKPMHLQPVFRGAATLGGDVAEDLFDRGLCLPSGSSLTEPMVDRVVEAVVGCRAPFRPALAL